MDSESGIQASVDEVMGLLGGGNQSESIKAISLLLKAQRPSGCWDHTGNPSCTAIQTVQAIDALLSIGMDSWLREPSSPIRLAANWLCEYQGKSSGKWGQDAFDTAEVLRVLIALDQEISGRGLEDPRLKDAIKHGVGYIVKQYPSTKDAFSQYRGLGWYGPAFWATAAVIFFLRQDIQSARKLLEEVWTFARTVEGTETGEDGSAYFECPDQANDTNLRIWNTAQTIIALTRLSDIAPSRARLAPFVSWLQYRQNCSRESENRPIYGSWGDDAAQVGGDTLPICTYSATVAICRAEGPRAQVQLGAEWFNRLIRAVDEDTPIGNTTLCAAAAMYSEVYGGTRLMPTLPLGTVLRLTELARSQYSELVTLRSEVGELRGNAAKTLKAFEDEKGELTKAKEKLQKDLESYAIKIKRDELTVWGVISLVVGVLSVVISLILSFIRK